MKTFSTFLKEGSWIGSGSIQQSHIDALKAVLKPYLVKSEGELTNTLPKSIIYKVNASKMDDVIRDLTTKFGKPTKLANGLVFGRGVAVWVEKPGEVRLGYYS